MVNMLQMQVYSFFLTNVLWLNQWRLSFLSCLKSSVCELPGNGAELGAVEEGNTANRGCCIQHVCGCVSGADMPQHTTYSN